MPDTSSYRRLQSPSFHMPDYEESSSNNLPSPNIQPHRRKTT
ncbi:MAG: hypothetical protein R2788_19670 [Saprospiraceae bacterium]